MMPLFSLLLVLIFCSWSTENSNHILIIAPPIFSHMISLLELAKQLSAHCHVTYLISASKIKELERKGFIPTINNSPTLDIVGLIDGNVDSLELELQDSRSGAMNSIQVVVDDGRKLFFDNTINGMVTALNQLFYSNSSLCSSLPIGSCTLNSSSFQSATTRPIFLPIDMIIIESFAPLPLYNFSIPIHLFIPSNLRGAINFMNKSAINDSALSKVFEHFRANIRRATGFICNSLEEFDEKYIDKFHQVTGNPAPIRFVGPLIFNSEQSTESKTKEIIDWLNRQPVASVVYVAFGSIVRLSSYTIDIIARALSNHSFIWSLKTKTSLPPSLLNLDSNRQLVLEWTPQRAILAHPAIALFFSHGGWNSLLEGMLHGKAILAWPFFGDQFGNALQLVEMGMAYQVSEDLPVDLEHMLLNNSYLRRAEEIQQIVINARETTSKQRIMDIVRLLSNNGKEHDEL